MLSSFACIFLSFPRENGTMSKEGIKGNYSRRGLAEACQFVYNDAKFVNERAQSDISLLSR